MDSGGDDISTLKRKSTLELSEVNSTGRKSSRVHAVASVRAATSKVLGASKTSTDTDLQNCFQSLFIAPSKASSLKKMPNKASMTKSTSKTILTKTTNKGSLTKSSSKASFTKAASKGSLTKSTSKASLTKSTSKASLTKSTSKASLTKSTSKASLTKSTSKGSLTRSTSKGSLTKSTSKGSLTKSTSNASLTKSTSKASLTKSHSNTRMTNAAAFKSRLTSKDSDDGGKKLWFFKGCHVAVRAQAGRKFYLCRLQQNVFNYTKDVKVRWLSVAGVRFFPNIYRMSYLDRINPASILMQVELSQKSRLRYLLPSDQEQEIENMIRLVEDVESGKISIQNIDDDVHEIVQIDEPLKKKPKMVKTASQRVKDKALKTATKKSSSKSSPRGKKTEKKVKVPKEKKERKRKLPKKEEELKLNPRPSFKVLDKDPLFETREPMPYVSKVSNSKLVYRAINLGDAAMLKKLLKDERRIKNLHKKSVSHSVGPISVLAKNLNKEVMTVLVEEFMEGKFSKRLENNPDDITNLDRMDTGRYNQKSLAVSRIRNIQASRGSKEGNNAFLHSEQGVSRLNWTFVVDSLTSHGVSYSTVEELEEHFKKLKPSQSNLFAQSHYGPVDVLLTGQHKKAAKRLKKCFYRRHIASESLMMNVLQFDDEDLPQCPPSAVKEICKRAGKITAVHCAAANPNSKYLSKLLSVEPNPQVPDGRGRRPIHYAAGCSSPDNLKLLLAWRVNTHDTCSDSNIPLHYAILASRAENVEVLINHDKKSSTSDPNVIRYGIGGVNRPMKNSLMPLHQTALKENVNIARILLDNGASVNATTSVSDFKRTPLQIAAGTGNLEMVKLLVDRGAVVEQKDRLGRTALLMACMNGATKVLSYLLHIGANPERADSSDNTPLHYAAAYGWYFTVRMLMDVGVDPNATNIWKISPLFVAYMKGHVGIVRQLLSYSSISINQVLNDGSTLLFHACQSDLTQDDLYEQIEYMVKEKGALCDIKDVNGKTALFYLASACVGDGYTLSDGHLQSTKIAELLLDNGCDVDAVDDNGFTALMHVLGSVWNTSLANFLMTKGSKVFTPAAGERKTTVLHAICENVFRTNTGLTKLMGTLKQTKYIKGFQEMAKCYDKAGFTPLLQLCSKGLYYHFQRETHGDNPSENIQKFVEFIKFLVETLHSPINAVVSKKYLTPDALLPPEDSDEWYENLQLAGRNALMLILSSSIEDSTMGTEKENEAITIIQYLINKGTDLNTVDRNGLTLLCLLVDKSVFKLMKYVGEIGSCDVDYEIKGEPPLHLLHKCCRLAEVRALLDIGCNPNVLSKDEKYMTFLHRLILGREIAATRDDILQTVEKLLANESNGLPGFDFNTQDWNGMTVLHDLARRNPGTLSTSLELEFLIIQNGCKVGIQDKKGRTPLHYVFMPKYDRRNWQASGRDKNVDATQLTQMIAKCMTAKEINARDYSGKTALHRAAQMGASVSCVTLLTLESTKADISLYDKDGNTALTLAVLNKKDACAVSLIQSGASLKDDVVQLPDKVRLARKVSRKKAYRHGEAMDEEVEDDDSAYWTIEEQKYIKQEVKETRIPLYEAAMENGLQGVAMLISQADPSKSGCTPLDFVRMAFEKSHYNIALEILYNQWNSGQLRKLDKDGRNLLHLLAISCRHGDETEDPIICKVAKFLIKDNMPLEQKDKLGLYPIHWAMINQNFDLADLLAEHSTTYDKDPNGRLVSYLEACLWRIHSKRGISAKVWSFLDRLGEKGMNFNKHIKLPLYPELFCEYVQGCRKDPELSERNSAAVTTALIASIRSTEFKQNITANLLASGASPNLADGHQVTPLMHAVMKNDENDVSILLNYNYPDCMKEIPTVVSSSNKKKKPNTSIFRLKPQGDDDDDGSESEDEDDDSINEETDKEKNEDEWKPVPKTSPVDLDAKDRNGRTALHYVACQHLNGTFDNAKLAFLLVKAGAKELKDKAGMTPYALAMKVGALNVVDTLKSLGHGKKDNCKLNFDRSFPVNDGITFKSSLRTRPDFRKDAQLVTDEEMEEDRAYEHTIDSSCTVQNGNLMKDDTQDMWYDVLLTKVDVKRSHYALYNFYKMQLVQQSTPNLYILFTSWGCIGMEGQFQHTPFSDLDAAVKEFCKIFREKTGNKWESVKDFEIKPRKYRLLDDSMRLAPSKMKPLEIDVESRAQSNLPDHLLEVMNKIMNPKALVKAMERLHTLSMESLPFGKLSRERLQQGRKLLRDIMALVEEGKKISELKEEERVEKEPRHTEICEKIAEISNEYFHTIPQRNFVYESIRPLHQEHEVVSHLQAVDNLLDYEIACQMLKGAMTCKADIHPADYIYRCLDCKLELMQPTDHMSQLILKYIYSTGDSDDNITGIYKVDRAGESAKLEKTGLENRRLLFHGTSSSNLLSILSRGLVTIFPEHGSSYGNGIYFADHFHKSKYYSGDSGFMFLCEVAMGEPYLLHRTYDFPDDRALGDVLAEKGCNSLAMNLYSNHMALKNWFKLPSGVSVNFQPVCHQSYSPEYVVINPDQVCIRYLIKFERKL